MAEPINVEERTQYELEGEYPRLWATIKRDFPDLPIEQQVKIGELVTGVCGSCRDDTTRCQCWNDE